MNLNKQERQTLYVALIAVLTFVLTRVQHDFLTSFYSHDYYLILHTLLELFSIFVALSIFFYGVLTFSYTQSQKRILLALVFLSVGAFDVFHTLSYKGMPFYQIEGSVAIPTWLWIMGRATECIGVGWILFHNKEKAIRVWQKNIYIVITSLYIVTILFIILRFHGELPLLVQEELGVTPLKVTLEYIISFIHLITMIYLLFLYKKTKDRNTLTIIVGLVFITVSELVFTLYHNVFDMDNLLGHVYKVIGYFFLLKGIFFPQFKQVYDEKNVAESNWHTAEEKLKQHEKTMTKRILQVQEEERKRVSRELHDGIGQALYSILMSLRMVRQIKLKDEVKEQLESIEQLTSSTMVEVKQIAHELRPSALDDLGLYAAIRSYIQRYEKTYGIHVDLLVTGKKKRFAQDIETTLYRIFQESLTNAAKYSKTSQVEILIQNHDHEVEVHIKDFGQGFDVNKIKQAGNSGLGLYGMKERVDLFHGTFEITSKTGQGTTINISIPYGKPLIKKQISNV